MNHWNKFVHSSWHNWMIWISSFVHFNEFVFGTWIIWISSLIVYEQLDHLNIKSFIVSESFESVRLSFRYDLNQFAHRSKNICSSKSVSSLDIYHLNQFAQYSWNISIIVRESFEWFRSQFINTNNAMNYALFESVRLWFIDHLN